MKTTTEQITALLNEKRTRARLALLARGDDATAEIVHCDYEALVKVAKVAVEALPDCGEMNCRNHRCPENRRVKTEILAILEGKS